MLSSNPWLAFLHKVTTSGAKDYDRHTVQLTNMGNQEINFADARDTLEMGNGAKGFISL
ncbi:MAG: hypothetical protein PV340_05835 [Wolbachia sp.]|nr:hypothetical protein [Wolbachia sp.]